MADSLGDGREPVEVLAEEFPERRRGVKRGRFTQPIHLAFPIRDAQPDGIALTRHPGTRSAAKPGRFFLDAPYRQWVAFFLAAIRFRPSRRPAPVSRPGCGCGPVRSPPDRLRHPRG
jgi:hypothetical protein